MSTGLNFVTGDATRPDLRGRPAGPGVIAHVVNDRPAWGRGFVLALSAAYKEPEAAYRADPPRIGSVRIVQVSRQLYVANLCAQSGLPGRDNPRPLDMLALESTLLTLRDFARREGASVHLPRIGAGLARGHWPDIEALLEKTLKGLNVTVYDLP